MAKYKILIALLSGGGFASVLILLLNVHVQIISVIASALLFPGGALATLLARSNDFSPALGVLAADGLLYSAVALIVIFACCRNVKAAAMRLFLIRLAFPAIILICLASVPALNPLAPRGLAELAEQERELQNALPLGMGLDHARAVLRSKGIRYQEETQTSEAVVLKREGKEITADVGDQVLFARLDTKASQFPCGYELEMVLLFGRDEKLKQQHIQRLRQCP